MVQELQDAGGPASVSLHLWPCTQVDRQYCPLWGPCWKAPGVYTVKLLLYSKCDTEEKGAGGPGTPTLPGFAQVAEQPNHSWGCPGFRGGLRGLPRGNILTHSGVRARALGLCGMAQRWKLGSDLRRDLLSGGVGVLGLAPRPLVPRPHASRPVLSAQGTPWVADGSVSVLSDSE